MTDVVEVIDPRLDNLAETIEAEHRLLLMAGTAMIEHAIRCGEALLEAKGKVPHGEWEAWLLRTFPNRSVKTWRLYMRVARHQRRVRAVGPASLHDAHRLLAGAPVLPHAETLKARARHLREAEGWSYHRIATELGVSHHAAAGWCNPELAEKRRARTHQQTKTWQRAAQLKARAKLVDEHGGALADAYRKARLAGQSLQEGLEMGGVSDEAAGAMQLAVTKLAQAEDEIVRAVRAS